MASLVEKVHLIKSDPVNNNNKFWIGELYDDDSVVCRWGRVGDTGQSKSFPSGGKKFLDSKVRSKKKSGRNGEIAYREIEIIDGAEATIKNTNSNKHIGGNNLATLAKKQIRSSSKNQEVLSLIDFLTKQNIHNITSFSGGNITYNYDTGLFQTPMGLVSQSTIDEARAVLNGISDCVVSQDYGDNLMRLHRDYCMLIPQDIGRRRIELDSFWDGINKVQAQSQVLDGLQASLVTASTTPKTKGQKVDTVEEQIFNTELDVVTNTKVRDRIINNYLNMRSHQHNCYHYRPIQIWSVHIHSMRDAYKKHGAGMENIIEGYHGTGSENILSLLKTGFLVRPPSNAAISGKMFGNGTYTAPCHIKGSSTKSTNYAVGYWGGKSSQRTFNFVCDVAMGKYHTPRGPYGGPPAGYDSCWAKGNQSGVLNDETVVYKESQIDIKYLIELTPK